MDLSKAFDAINHDLLIAKLRAYGFEEGAIKLLKIWERPKQKSRGVVN